LAHSIKALLSHYDAAFTQKFGARYPISPKKDCALAKQLLALYTFEQLAGWVDDFFALEDEWIEQSGYSFGVFRSQLGKVIASKTMTSPRIERPKVVQTRHNTLEQYRVIK
jgi:hypothetical protein